MSTLIDYLAFVQMLVNRGTWNGHQLVRPETLDLMRTNQLPENVNVNFSSWEIKGSSFGLGFALKETVRGEEPLSAVGEYQWAGIGGAHLWIAPQANLAGICMTQQMPAFFHPFSRDFRRLAYQIAAS